MGIAVTSCAIGDAQEASLFVKVLIVENFAFALESLVTWLESSRVTLVHS